MDQLALGDTLLLTFADLGDRHAGVLVGKKQDDCLLVYAELSEKIRTRLRKNPTVTVQFAFESTLLGFTTRLNQERCAPGALLSLAWPEQTQNMDRRSEKRLSCLFQGRLRPRPDDERDVERDEEPPNALPAADCIIEDISPSALRVRLLGPEGESSWAQLEPDLACGVDISALDRGQYSSAHCSVLRRFRKHGHPYAVLMLDPGEPVRGLIRDYMGRALGEPMPSGDGPEPNRASLEKSGSRRALNQSQAR